MSAPLTVKTYSPHWNAFELMLVDWGLDHFSEAVAGIENKWGDVGFEKKCLGAIFRRQCKVDPGWVWKALRAWPKEILQLSPSIGSLVVAGETFPGRLTWSQWIDSVQTVEGAEQQAKNEAARAEVAMNKATPSKTITTTTEGAQ
jgi:hypothetical protein